MDWNSKQTETR